MKPKSKSKEGDRPTHNAAISVNSSLIMNFNNMSLLTADDTVYLNERSHEERSDNNDNNNGKESVHHVTGNLLNMTFGAPDQN